MIVKSCERLNFRCPTCKSLMNSWTLPRIHDPARPISDRRRYYSRDESKGRLDGKGTLAFRPGTDPPLLPMSPFRHYDFHICHVREIHVGSSRKSLACFSTQSRVKRNFFECFSPVGKWKMIEYKSAQLPPMQWHLIGPLPISDGQSLKSPWGFTACSYSQDFQHATQKILREWGCY